MLHGLAERVSSSASAKVVYGDPVVVGDRTVIPAAQVRYGFGGGGGRRKGDEAAGREGSGSGGGGGGAFARPVGAIEITPRGTRFIRFDDSRILPAAVLGGFLLGFAIASLRAPRRIEIRKQQPTARRDS